MAEVKFSDNRFVRIQKENSNETNQNFLQYEKCSLQNKLYTRHYGCLNADTVIKFPC